MATTTVTMYQMFIKPQRESNKEFKERQNASNRKYMKKMFHERYPNDAEFREKRLELARQYSKTQYNNNEQYKEEKKRKSRERYYKNKEIKQNKNAEDKALEFFRNLFE